MAAHLLEDELMEDDDGVDTIQELRLEGCS